MPRGRFPGMGPAELSLQPWDPVSPHLAQAHGNVFTTWVGPTPVVVLSGFWVVKEALVSNLEQFSGRPLTPLFRDVFGERGKATLSAGNGVAGW